MTRPLVSTVSAHVRERIVVNLAVSPRAMAEEIPCDWLLPQIVDGRAIVTFCVLWLQRVTPRGWPKAIMPSQVSCAIRFGVIDEATGEPGVYVVDRCTDSAIGSLATRFGCPGFHPLVRITEATDDAKRLITAERSGSPYMAFELRAPNEECGLFGSKEVFQQFLSEGVRSFTPAVRPDTINVVDLVKTETEFVPHAFSLLEDSGLPSRIREDYVVDSAFRTLNAEYEWCFVEQQPIGAKGLVA